MSGLLRRKERIEDALAVGRRDPATRVGDGDLHLILARPGTSRHLDSPVGRRGVDRVGEEVQDHLLELIALAQDRWQPGLGAHGEGEPGAGESRADQLGGVANQRVEVDRGRLTGHAARGVEEPADDVDDARHLRLDDAEAPRDVLGQERRRQVLAEQLQMSRDRVQRGADLVSDFGHDAAGEREALGVTQPPLHLVEQDVQLLDLSDPMVELAGGFGDTRPELLAESLDARHHLVEVPGEHAELVRRRHRDRSGRAVVRDRGDRVHEAPDRAVHDDLDGDGHQDAHQHQRGALPLC